MEDTNNERVAGGATSACETQPADHHSMQTEDTLCNMQAAAPQYDAGGQLRQKYLEDALHPPRRARAIIWVIIHSKVQDMIEHIAEYHNQARM